MLLWIFGWIALIIKKEDRLSLALTDNLLHIQQITNGYIAVHIKIINLQDDSPYRPMIPYQIYDFYMNYRETNNLSDTADNLAMQRIFYHLLALHKCK